MDWRDQKLVLLDQTLLPGKVEYINCTSYLTVAEAIERLQVRGAPAIGAAAAFGMVLGATEAANKAKNFVSFKQNVLDIAARLERTRPTAVNLAWALRRMLQILEKYNDEVTLAVVVQGLEAEAIAIFQEDAAVNEQISKNGALLFGSDRISVLTHCNAGALATVAHGTALGIIREAYNHGRITMVFADETRPLLQGARLTTWELLQDGIPVTLITDNMAGWVMKQKKVAAVIVGADRIALNGDVANKIGTYSLAVLAKEHKIPFYVAAPVSTFDFSIESGDEIPIEERKAEEVISFGGQVIAPEGVGVYNPAFDVTPNRMITAIITEHGILRSPYVEAIAELISTKG